VLGLVLGLAPAIPTASEALGQRGGSARVPKPKKPASRTAGRTAAGGQVGRPAPGSNPSVGGANQFSRRAARSAARDRNTASERTGGAPRQDAARGPRSATHGARPRAPRQQAQRQAQRQAMAQAQAERQALVREVSAFTRLRARTIQVRSLAIS